MKFIIVYSIGHRVRAVLVLNTSLPTNICHSEYCGRSSSSPPCCRCSSSSCRHLTLIVVCLGGRFFYTSAIEATVVCSYERYQFESSISSLIPNTRYAKSRNPCLGQHWRVLRNFSGDRRGIFTSNFAATERAKAELSLFFALLRRVSTSGEERGRKLTHVGTHSRYRVLRWYSIHIRTEDIRYPTKNSG